MSNERNFGKRELEQAWNRGGQTYSGAAYQLNCSPTTFKKYWVELQRQQSLRTRTPTRNPNRISEFADPNVEKIVDEYRQQKQDVTTGVKKVIFELVDKIDEAKRQVSDLNEQIVKQEKYLKTLQMEE